MIFIFALQQAIKCYMKALKLDPGNEKALDSMAGLLAKLDKVEEAVKWYVYYACRSLDWQLH